MKTGLYLTLFILTSVLCACKKDDNTPSSAPPPSQSRYSILTSHYWRNSVFYMRMIGDLDLNGIPDTTYYNQFPDTCETDDKNYFKSNGYLVTDDGPITCQTSGDSLIWALANNDT